MLFYFFLHVLELLRNPCLQNKLSEVPVTNYLASGISRFYFLNVTPPTTKFPAHEPFGDTFKSYPTDSV